MRVLPASKQTDLLMPASGPSLGSWMVPPTRLFSTGTPRRGAAPVVIAQMIVIACAHGHGHGAVGTVLFRLELISNDQGVGFAYPNNSG